MTTQQQTTKTNQSEIGALWERTSQKGQKYWAGHLKHDETGSKTEMKIVVFPITDKKNERSPDFRIYISNLASAKTETNHTQAVEKETELMFLVAMF